MGQLGELCSFSVASAGASGESQGFSTHHHRRGGGHDLVLPPGLEQGQRSGCLSWSVSSLRSSTAEMHSPVPPKPGWLQLLWTFPKFLACFLDCWSFRPWACSHGTTSLWNAPHWQWGISPCAVELCSCSDIQNTFAVTIGWCWVIFSFWFPVPPRLVPAGLLTGQMFLFHVAAFFGIAIHLWCFPGCMFCWQHLCTSVVLLSWEVHHAWW